MRALHVVFALALLGLTSLTDTPSAAAEEVSVVDVSAAGGHTCALMSDGGVKCWGLNTYGQLGDGREVRSDAPVDVCNDYDEVQGVCQVRLTGAVAVAAGGLALGHSCAILQGGALVCWGSHYVGQLGVGDREIDLCVQGDPPDHTPCSRTPVTVSGLDSGVVDVLIGSEHSCALMETGGLKCWGENYFGHLGDGTTVRRDTPVDVVGLDGPVLDVALNYSQSCTVTSDTRVRCWGANIGGSVGAPTTELCVDPFTLSEWPCSTVPLPVCRTIAGNACDEEFDGATSVSVGGNRGCVTTMASSVYCWGSDDGDQLGIETTDECPTGGPLDGEVPCSRTPVQIPGVDGAVSAANASDHTCATVAGGRVTCWGMNNLGQLGDGTTDDSSTPVHVCVALHPAAGCQRLTGVTELASTFAHACVVVSGGVKCWGVDGSGKLGNGGHEFGAQTLAQDVVGLGPKAPPGDASCDGAVTSVDAALVLQYDAQLLEALPCPDAADANTDGAITSVDAALILQMSAGLLDGG